MNNKINFGKRTIDALPLPETGRARYRDTGTRFLYLDVFPSGRKTFLYVRKVHGTTSFIKLGDYREMTPTEAREKAEAQSRKIGTGISPQEVRAELKRGGNTFADYFNEYFEKHLKPNTRQWPEDLRCFNVYLKPFHNKAAKAIFPEDVRRLHKTLTQERGGFMANRCIQLVRATYNYAIEQGSYIPNPAAKFKKNPEASRARFLDEVEINRFFKALETIEPFWQDFFKIALFTGARRANVQSMAWADLDIERRIWTIRAEEFKTGEKKEIVLSEPVIEILIRRLVDSKSDYVFPSHGKSKHVEEPKGVWKKLIDKAKIKDFHIHDLRRTFGSYQAKTGASLPIIGKSLGHTGTDATAIYARLDLQPVRESVEKATAAIMKAAKGKDK